MASSQDPAARERRSGAGAPEPVVPAGAVDDSLLQTVVDLSKSVMPGQPETSVLLLVEEQPTTVVHTGQRAVDLDETQDECGHGPCLHTARTSELTEIADTRTETRWPDYVGRAAERGDLSPLSMPLIIDEDEQSRAR
ncbi:GAF domain-containing protein [Geodermatophilus sp. URMC 63]